MQFPHQELSEITLLFLVLHVSILLSFIIYILLLEANVPLYFDNFLQQVKISPTISLLKYIYHFLLNYTSRVACLQ